MIHYPFTKLSDLAFEFITDHGNEYKAFFISYAYLFPDHPDFSSKVYSFNLEKVGSALASHLTDDKIGQTVVEIFQQFFAAQDNVSVYICDNADDRHLARKRKFDLWFWKYNNGSILKEDGMAVVGNMEIYNSLLLHKHNKFANEIIEAFRTLNERADDK